MAKHFIRRVVAILGEQSQTRFGHRRWLWSPEQLGGILDDKRQASHDAFGNCPAWRYAISSCLHSSS